MAAAQHLKGTQEREKCICLTREGKKFLHSKTTTITQLGIGVPHFSGFLHSISTQTWSKLYFGQKSIPTLQSR